MVVVLIGICAVLAIQTLEPGPAIPGARGTQAFVDAVASSGEHLGGDILLVLPTEEQLTERGANPPLGPDGNPLGLMDLEVLRDSVGVGQLFAESIDYDPNRREMTVSLRRALQDHPDARVVAFVDQTHDRLEGIVATISVSAGREIAVQGPPRSTVSVFLRKRNLINIARQISVFAIIAVGMTMVILTGGIDLSVGSLVALLGVVVALVLSRPDGIPVWGWSVLGLALGAGVMSALGTVTRIRPGRGGIGGGLAGASLGLGVALLLSGRVAGVDIDVPSTAQQIGTQTRDPVTVVYAADLQENRETVEGIADALAAEVTGLHIDASNLGVPGRRTVVRDSLRAALDARPESQIVVTLDPVAFELAQEVTVGGGVRVIAASRRVMGLMLFALILTVVVGAAVGVFTGTVINVFRIPPFIATLAMMYMARGMAYTLSGGRAIRIPYDEFTEMIGRGFVLESWFGELLPVPVLMMLTAYMLAYLALSYTPFGRYIYAVGGNDRATHLSGISVGGVRFLAYVVTAITAALGGIIMASKLGSGDPNSALLYELYVIAACVVGGTSLQGGEGKIFGTLTGALLLGVLFNGLTLLQVDTYLQMVVIGAVILLAVLLDQAKKRL